MSWKLWGKTALRVKELKEGNPNFPCLLGQDNIGKKLNIRLDYTPHELKSFVELMQATKGDKYLYYFPRNCPLWDPSLRLGSPILEEPSILYYNYNLKRFELLTNDKLEYIMRERYKIWK